MRPVQFLDNHVVLVVKGIRIDLDLLAGRYESEYIGLHVLKGCMRSILAPFP